MSQYHDNSRDFFDADLLAAMSFVEYGRPLPLLPPPELVSPLASQHSLEALSTAAEEAVAEEEQQAREMVGHLWDYVAPGAEEVPADEWWFVRHGTGGPIDPLTGRTRWVAAPRSPTAMEVDILCRLQHWPHVEQLLAYRHDEGKGVWTVATRHAGRPVTEMTRAEWPDDWEAMFEEQVGTAMDALVGYGIKNDDAAQARNCCYHPSHGFTLVDWGVAKLIDESQLTPEFRRDVLEPYAVRMYEKLRAQVQRAFETSLGAGATRRRRRPEFFEPTAAKKKKEKKESPHREPTIFELLCGADN